jgi:hypothetical protein
MFKLWYLDEARYEDISFNTLKEAETWIKAEICDEYEWELVEIHEVESCIMHLFSYDGETEKWER